ncbi:dehydrogenase [Artomyces pyxidatus]|uniref:Dehydrogenase n=1 Tax=Artomyces pyxidatus TaxID=48021 RepID=A0ACB8TF97_9AGAM|nr:dehydrogenase [Artomyces pyxidatus]
MAPSTHKAAVLSEDGTIIVKEVDVPKVGAGQVLVKVVAGAQNPSDWKTALGGKRYGAVIGNDFSGTVVEIGPDVPAGLRTVGERVAGFVRGGVLPNGAFAEYVVADAKFGIVHVPDSWSFEDAAQLGIAPFTALQTLWQSQPDLPTPDAPATTHYPIFISGGASSVGQYAIQFAKLAGLHVIATASKTNFELVKSLGADEVYDYNDPDIASKIKASTGGKLKNAVDTISEGASVTLISEVLSEEGGEVGAILPYKPPRENLKVSITGAYSVLGKDYDFPVFHAITPREYELGELFVKYVNDALASGHLKPNPLLIIPNGLAGVQEGFQYMISGKVRAQKITYRISDTPGL